MEMETDQTVQSVPPLTKKLVSPFDKIQNYNHNHNHNHRGHRIRHFHRHRNSEHRHGTNNDTDDADNNQDNNNDSTTYINHIDDAMVAPSIKLQKHQSPSSLRANTFLYIDATNNDTTLLNIVRNQHESNRRCCDCNTTQNVDWISINLLCVLCITCSGVHRSLGSHISKIRSLTLDVFKSPELIYLIENNVSNYLTNSIYEATLDPKFKLNNPIFTDTQRTRFITSKYIDRLYVADGHKSHDESLRHLIKAIHLNSIHLLQQTIAQSDESLKKLTSDYISPSSGTTLFKYSLRHYAVVDEKLVFYVTEFLLLNGVEVDCDLPVGKVRRWPRDVVRYWEKKLEVYGGGGNGNGRIGNSESNFAIAGANANVNANSNTNSSTSSKRWNLGHSVHKSLKMTKNLIKNGK